MWYEWLGYIVLMIVILSVLISIHEAGHLTMAKIFKVYCFEYSIGFGPALLHKKRKNGETYFSLRIIPFGGYVSMYGEGGAVPEGREEPPAERSLEAIAKWKKCFILLAGVTMNFLLGILVIYLSEIACPRYFSGTIAATDANTGAATLLRIETILDDKTIEFVKTNPKYDPDVGIDNYRVMFPSLEKESYYVVDSDVVLEHKNAEGTYVPEPDHYVAIYGPATVVASHNINDSIHLFPVDKNKTVSARDITFGITNYPYVFDDQGNSQEIVISKLTPETRFEINVPIVPLASAEKDAESVSVRNTENFIHKRIEGSGEGFTFVVGSNGAINRGGVDVGVLKHWNSFGESWEYFGQDFPNACTAIVKGFASLFTPGGIKNLSGVVGITAALPQINANGGAHMILYFVGMLSINLAFFNLLPFPALDGYSFLVTVIEGITKKKVPQKVANIVSLVGFILLFGLMILITVKDIIGLF